MVLGQFPELSPLPIPPGTEMQSGLGEMWQLIPSTEPLTLVWGSKQRAELGARREFRKGTGRQPHLWELLQNLLWWGLGFPAFLLHTFCLQNPLWIPACQSRLSPREKPEGFVSPQRDQSVFESTNLIWATPQLLLEGGDQFGCSAREKLLWQGRALRCCLFQPGSHPHTEWEFSVTLGSARPRSLGLFLGEGRGAAQGGGWCCRSQSQCAGSVL